MNMLRAFRSHQFQSLVKLKTHLENPPLLSHSFWSNPIQSSSVSSICYKPFSLLAFFKRQEDAELINPKNVEDLKDAVGILEKSKDNETESGSDRQDAELINPEDIEEKNKKTRKPLDVYFKEAVGILEKSKDNETESGSDSEDAELKKRLRKLENELRGFQDKRKDDEGMKKKNKNQVADNDDGHSKPESLSSLFVAKNDDGLLKYESKPGNLSATFEVAKKDGEQSKHEGIPENLSALFGNKARESNKLTMEDPQVYKELSPDMEMFVTHLYRQGYFVKSNFLRRNRLDMTCFENSYSRDFIKFAAVQFGKDNQEIAKWLSGSDLKKVALFGCPSLGRKNVSSAKRLRAFFRIQEDTVCSKCSLKESCKFVNQRVWNGDTKNLNLVDVMKVVILYALESLPPQLVVADEIKTAVSRLLKEVIKLSKTVS